MPGRSASPRRSVRSSTPARLSPPSRPISITAPAPMAIPAAPSFGQTIKEGFGVGIGVSIADRLVGSVLGPRKVEVAAAPAAPVAVTAPLQPCREQESLLNSCLQKTKEGGFGCMTEVQAYQDCLQKFNGYGPSK